MNRARFFRSIWCLALFLLPFTSLPLAAKILRSQMVAAPSIILIALLGLVWLIPFLIHNPLDLAAFPLIVLALYSLIITLLAIYSNIPVIKYANLISINLEAFATLLIGIILFVVPLHYLRSNKTLTRSLKFIYAGLVPLFIWSLMQFTLDQSPKSFPGWMETAQSWLTTSAALFHGRITGFAYEPSWVAHQLNLLYIPILAGFTITRQSIFKRRLWHFSIENLLLICSLLLLFLSKSRIGWLTFFVCLVYAVIVLNQTYLEKIRNRNIKFMQVKWKIALPVFLVAFYILVFIGGMFVASKIDPRMEQVFNPVTYQNRGVLSIANEFLFAERILYWQAGWEIFNDHPIFGVGLGNFGFHFENYMPAFAWALDEPRALLFQAGYLANNKNLWTRLLSETGIIGFVIFCSWLVLLWKSGKNNVERVIPFENTWKYVLRFALIAIMIEGFSIDSFAMPYLWTILGISMAAKRISGSPDA